MRAKPPLRRVASHGNGWYGFNRDPAAARVGIARLEARLRDAGRGRSDVQVCIGPNVHPVTRETVAQYEDAGVDQIVVPLRVTNTGKLRARVDAVLAEVSL